MLEDMSKDALFYNYYTQWIEVYKKDAIREATMAKYRMTQKWVEKLAPELKVCELTRTAYQKILNDYAKEHERQTTLDFHHQLKGTFHSFVEPGKELDTAKMYRVAADKFILNITFAWEHAVAITDNNDAGKLVSHRFPQFSFNPKLKPHFFKYLMLDKKFREHLELSSPGGAGRNRVLKISDMLKYEIKLPSIEEQIKIGEYFDSLDHLITLHQRQHKLHLNMLL